VGLFWPFPLPSPLVGLHGVGLRAALRPPGIPTPCPLPSLGRFCPLGFLSLILFAYLFMFVLSGL